MLDSFFNYMGQGIDWFADHSASSYRMASTWPLWTKMAAVGVMAVLVTWRLANSMDKPSAKKRRM